MSDTHQEITEAQAKALIDRHRWTAASSPIMGGTFWYEPGSPTGFPHVRVGHYLDSGYPGDRDRWVAARELEIPPK